MCVGEIGVNNLPADFFAATLPFTTSKTAHGLVFWTECDPPQAVAEGEYGQKMGVLLLDQEQVEKQENVLGGRKSSMSLEAGEGEMKEGAVQLSLRVSYGCGGDDLGRCGAPSGVAGDAFVGKLRGCELLWEARIVEWGVGGE